MSKRAYQSIDGHEQQRRRLWAEVYCAALAKGGEHQAQHTADRALACFDRTFLLPTEIYHQPGDTR